MKCELIKVCGMRDADNISALDETGIDLMGFIFWPHSSRYVSRRPEYMPSRAKRVGVFVDEDIDTIKRIADDYALDYIQLHGHESPAYCTQLQDWRIIKAFSIASSDDLKQTNAYEGCTDCFLFDTKGMSVGGNGVQFDWSILDSYYGSTPFLLSGGIGPDDAQSIRDNNEPYTAKCIGIDLNSRFETAPALKDINKIQSFIKTVRP